MATRFRMTHPSEGEVVILLDDKRVVVDTEVLQMPSSAAAREHVERLVFVQGKRGYRAEPPEALESEDVRPIAAAPRIDDVKVALADGRMTVTLEGDRRLPHASARAIVERIAVEGPRVLQIVCDFASPGAAWPEALAERTLPSLGAVIFDTFFQTQTRQRDNAFGDLAATLAACPSLERFFATGKLALTPMTHTTLRVLHLLGDPIAPAALKALGASSLPSLERLVLSLASDAGPGSDRGALAALAVAAPRLREVVVESLTDPTHVLDALAQRGLPPSWRTLVLDGTLDEDALFACLAHRAAALGSLQVLALSTGDYLSQEGEARAQALLGPIALRDAAAFHDLSLPAAYAEW